MNILLKPVLSLTYNQISSFAYSDNFWNLFDTTFGTQYDRSLAEILRLQWLSGDFSQIPQIEILDSSILGNANGAYASSTNKIYLSNTFVNTSTDETISAVLLEEIGHFVDAFVNQTDSAGDEGAIFSELVQGESLDANTLQALKAEDDHATFTINGQIIQVEQQNFTGTSGNDTITGTSSNDTINSGLGYDTVDGGAGTDLLILDYSSVDTNLDVGGIGSSISSSSTGGFNGYFYAYYGSFYGTYRVNFSNIEQFQITGTGRSDSISTGDGNDTINGGAGNDNINAGGGNDTINGVNETLLTPGLGEKDTLTGGTGSDRFILGNATTAYYDDGNTLTTGSNDYADITDFNTGDIIQLQGTSSNYLLTVVGADTQILINKPGTEPDELIGIVRNKTGLSLTGSSFAYVTLPSITLAVSPSSVTEDGTTNLVYTFTRTGSTTNALTVNYSIAGTAASTDYTGATPGTGKTITFAAGSSTATLTIDPTADTTFESNETVALTLAAGTGYTVGTTTAVTGTITNDDVALPTVTLAVSPSSVAEDGTGNLLYTFTRTGDTTNTLTINYDITGTAASTDYTGATPGTGKTITFAAGSSTAILTIDPTADTTVEANETVALTLAAGTGYTVGTTTAVTGTITNDDVASSVTINLNADQTVVEGRTSPQNVRYTVTLSASSTQTITVQYATSNGTAIAGSDYTTRSGTLTFAPNTTSQFIDIPIINDGINEPNETFTLTLTSPTNASLGTKITATTTITDTLTASVTTTLPTNVENLTLTGTTAINATGNAGNNVLTGNSANNVLTGGNGNDTYAFVANSALGTDTITETTTGGTDTIDFTGTTVGVNVNLGVTTSQTVNSNLKLILSANNVIENATGGAGNDRLTGNTLNNTLSGGDGNDQLQGLAGDDSLQGGAGNDILNGGSSNDSLWGGLGDDILTGGLGNDKYLFQSDSVFNTSLGVDYISEFEAGLDQIVLSKTTFNAITNIVGEAFTDFAIVTDDDLVNASNARIVFSQGSGSLFYNQDGSVLGATAVFEFARLGNLDITLSSSNFSLVA
ncbi:beta strand repeat-containing protein [Anabaena azotica]|uniref:beta strand repeat-containing protein n=1 Tax=Anabaena azotica TaxID=197653 RepID=UPI0039A72F51